MNASDRGIASFGPFRLSPATREIARDGVPVALGDRALDLLIALVERAGDIVSHRELITRVWRGLVVNSGSLRVNVTGLRKALGDGESGVRYIENVTGQGYCFVAPVQWGSELPASETSEVEPSITADLFAERFVTAFGKDAGVKSPPPEHETQTGSRESHISVDVEYALHCLLFLLDFSGKPVSMKSRDLADLQGVPPEQFERIVARLLKAQIVVRVSEPSDGLILARSPDSISFLDVLLAIDGRRPLFECTNVRSRCAVVGGNAPAWATKGVCAIHAAMMEAEASMRAALARRSLAELASRVYARVPSSYVDIITNWLGQRTPDASRAP